MPELRPLRKVIMSALWPVVHNGIACFYVHELLECGHIQAKRKNLLGPYKVKSHRRCDACLKEGKR